jgi:hypothetical protein
MILQLASLPGAKLVGVSALIADASVMLAQFAFAGQAGV